MSLDSIGRGHYWLQLQAQWGSLWRRIRAISDQFIAYVAIVVSSQQF